MLQVKWGTVVISCCFWMMEDIPDCMIFGWDSIKFHKIDILHDDRAVLNHKDGAVTLPTVSTQRERLLAPMTLRVTADVTIAPGVGAYRLPVIAGAAKPLGRHCGRCGRR